MVKFREDQIRTITVLDAETSGSVDSNDALHTNLIGTTMTPQASSPGNNTFWVETGSPTTPYFTDSSGADIDLSGGGGGVTDHGALTGLSDDDHTQYLLVDGTRAMTGDLNMGSNAIISVGNVDGRDVSSDGAMLDSHIANVANPHTTTLELALAAGETMGSNNIIMNMAGSTIRSATADELAASDALTLSIQGGNGPAIGSGDGGDINILSGLSGPGGGESGDIIILTAAGSTKAGNIEIGTASLGDITISAGNDGDISIHTDDGASPGNISINGGNHSGSGNGGGINFIAGAGGASVGNSGGPIGILSGTGYNGAPISILAAAGTTGSGGNVTVAAGGGPVTSGTLELRAGDTPGGSSGEGATITMVGAVGTTGGSLDLLAGNGTTSNGGDVTITGGGATTADGGRVFITPGASSSGTDGGRVFITPGASSSGTDGYVDIKKDTYIRDFIGTSTPDGGFLFAANVDDPSVSSIFAADITPSASNASITIGSDGASNAVLSLNGNPGGSTVGVQMLLDNREVLSLRETSSLINARFATDYIYIANASSILGSPIAGGGALFVENGALKYIGENGTVTTLAPT